MHKVSGHGSPKRGPLKRFTVEKAGNGYTVSSEHDRPDGMHEYGMRAPEDAPAVFQKHQRGAAQKHMKDLMSKMHPEEDAQMQPGAPPMGQQS